MKKLEDSENYVEVFLSLIRCSVMNNESLLCKNILGAVSSNCLQNVYNLSKKHGVSQLIGYAIESSKFSLTNDKLIESFDNEEINKKKNVLKKFKNSLYSSVIENEKTQRFYNKISKFLIDNQIDFIPLKGIEIKKLYKFDYLRSQCDIDILLKKENFEKNLTKIINFFNLSIENRTEHDVELTEKNGQKLEFHFSLIEEGRAKNSEQILSKAFDFSKKIDKNKYKMDDEFFVFYHIAHMAKHLESSGCGIRPFIDLYYIKSKNFKDEILQNFLHIAGLEKFYKECCLVCDYVFDNMKPNEFTKNFTKFIINSGLYGNVETFVSINKTKSNSKIKYIFSRIFIPYNSLCLIYPSLKGKKALTFFFQIKRLNSILFNKKRKKHLNELNNFSKINENNEKEINYIIKNLFE